MIANKKINAWSGYATAYHWKALANYGVTEHQISDACGWKDARNVQYGNIFNRLKTLGEIDLYKQLSVAIKEFNR